MYTVIASVAGVESGYNAPGSVDCKVRILERWNTEKMEILYPGFSSCLILISLIVDIQACCLHTHWTVSCLLAGRATHSEQAVKEVSAGGSAEEGRKQKL